MLLAEKLANSHAAVMPASALKTKTKRLTINVSIAHEQHGWLAKRAEKEDRTIAAVLRRILDVAFADAAADAAADAESGARK